jgi:hypothetical protein
LKRLARRTLAASAAFAPAIAHAEDSTFGGGAFIGYHFGEGSPVEWGFEAFGTRVLNEANELRCNAEEQMRYGVGGFVRASFVGIEDVRLTLGGHAGGEVNDEPLFALTGELGASYRFGEHSGLGLHTGAIAETFLLNAAARYQWLRNDAWVGGGVRVMGTYGDWTTAPCPTPGRPLRVEGGLLELSTRAEVATGSSNAGARIAAVGRGFERDAQLEHASVPAFLQLATELARAGAPLSLVQRALSAASDEVRHAALCTQLAARHLDACSPPLLPALAARVPIASQASVVRLAVESWLDGCVAEGRAAALAARAAQLASDAQARAIQHAIAHDEHRHAELAWSILSWALALGGDEAHGAVSACRDAAASTASAEPEGLEAHGRLGARAIDAVAARHHELSRTRLCALLARA